MSESLPARPAVSLFSNCGAGDFGYKSAGFEFVVLAELVRKRLRVAQLNHPRATTLVGDLRTTWPEVVERYREREKDRAPWLLSACPPCQGMSSANSRRGKGDDVEAGGRDARNLLILPIVEVAKELDPRAIVVENVPTFLTRRVPDPATGDGISAASLMIRMLEERYAVFPFVSDLSDYGVPQRRRRAFLTLIRRDIAGLGAIIEQRRAPYPRPTHDPLQGGKVPIEVGAFLDGLSLPSLDARTDDTAKCNLPLHCVPVWSRSHYEMVNAIPAGSGGSAWENAACLSCGPVKAGPSDAQCPLCGEALPRPVVEDDAGGYRLVKGFRASSYRRMDPNRPAPAVTTANGTIGSANTIHPFENRVLSALECCHLQTIPDTFRWTKDDAWPLEVHLVRRMVGEAVPPQFTELHGHAVRGVLEDDWCIAPISMYDARCRRAAEKLGGMSYLMDGGSEASDSAILVGT